MGFLDNLRDRLSGRDDDYYDEDDYYDGEDEPVHERREGLLGNTSRPEAESVSVYTRSGRPVAGPAVDSYNPDAEREMPKGVYAPGYVPLAAESVTPARTVAASLPPYVLKPAEYGDVQSVVRRVRTAQPVVLVFRSTPIDTAKRILDFSYGFATGVNGVVEELGDRVFCVLPAGRALTPAEIDKLVADGDLAR